MFSLEAPTLLSLPTSTHVTVLAFPFRKRLVVHTFCCACANSDVPLAVQHSFVRTEPTPSPTHAAVIAFLIVESVVLLTLLHLYQLKLLVAVECARLGGVLAMVGLPTPVLQLMHKKPLVVCMCGYTCVHVCRCVCMWVWVFL
jgi:hypothetical protein